MDSIFKKKQQRLLIDPLYSTWAGPGDDRKFLALARIGFFHTVGQRPLVPDFMLSLDVSTGADLQAKDNHFYFLWLMGKPPEVVVEIVSNRKGGEELDKKEAYAKLGVLFYIVYDPLELLQWGVVRPYVLQRKKYERVEPDWFDEVNLGLTLWEGKFEGHTQTWLRWCDKSGKIIPTGAERAHDAQKEIDKLSTQLRALEGKPEE